MPMHVGEIAQDDRWWKQRSGTMIALHCRSWAGPVRSSSGQTSAADPYAQLGLTMSHQRIEPDEPSKSRPTSSLSEIGQDPQRALDLARREHIQQFWDSETDRAWGLGVFG
jgi:hypothetical protein